MEKYFDTDGTPIEVGDRIVLLEHQGASPGSLGTVVVCERTIGAGVQFDERFGGHDLDGKCPYGYGQWLMSHQFRRVAGGAAMNLDDDAGEIHKKLVEALAEKDKAIINGQLFEVKVVEDKESNILVDAIVEQFSKKVMEVQCQAKAAVEVERNKAKMMFPMPEITFEHIKKGVFVYKDTDWGYLGWGMPFHYAPKYLGRDYETPSLEISDKHKKELEKDVIFVLRTGKDGHIYGAGLYHQGLEETFEHYHGNGGDCLGITMERPDINSVEDFLKFGHHYERTLFTINDRHRNRDHPAGLPSYGVIMRDAKPIKLEETLIWNTKKKKTTDEPEGMPEGNFEVGQVVEILGEFEYMSRMGDRAKVIGVDEHDDTYSVLVEFTDKEEFWYPKNMLKIMKPGTRRRALAKIVEKTKETRTEARKPWRLVK